MNALLQSKNSNIMNGRTICLSVSKDNKRAVGILDDYCLEYGLSKSGTIFRIITDYHTSKLLERKNENS
jgi:hypothetical protein